MAYYIYRYTSKKDNIVKYIGIANNVIRRIKEHAKSDFWTVNEEFKIEQFECDTRSEAEAWESHLISLYDTSKYYNTFKKDWGLISFLKDIEPKWSVVEEKKDLRYLTKNLNIVGKEITLPSGLKCKIIKDNGDGTIIVKPENGEPFVTTYHNFVRKRIKSKNDTIPTNLLIERIGEQLDMKCGMIATIINYRGYNDIDVQLENGDIFEHIQYRRFKNRNLTPINSASCLHNHCLSEQRLHERKMMNDGSMAEIIEYKNSKDITVKFDSGYIKEHTEYKKFYNGCISDANKYKDARINETRIMNCGLKAKIIEYFNTANITVQFETGEIRQNVKYDKFVRGKISPVPRYGMNPHKIDKTQHIGEERVMNCGKKATVIEFYDYKHITVKFDSGEIRGNVDYGKFKEGHILPTNRQHQNSVIGETRIMNNGMKATIIEYYNSRNITVLFDNGSCRTNIRYDHFKNGRVAA